MGTVVRDGEFAVEVHGREHGVAHAHVRKGEHWAVVAVGPETSGPYLLEQTKMAAVDVRKALRLVETHRAAVLKEWERFNG